MTTTSNSNFNVLILDDDQGHRESLKWHISMTFESSAIFEASTVSEAEKIISEENLDCIVVDYMLPDADGLEFYTDLHKRVPFEKCPPCLMVTNFGDETIAAKAIKLGFYDYLPKDKINTESLKRSIENAISKNKVKIELYLKDIENKELMSQLQSLNEQLRNFVGIVAHDLRNPLGNIQALSEMAKDAETKEELDNCLNYIKDSGDSALINSVRKVSNC